MTFRAVGSYIFAGGFTLGMEKHFKILAHLEESNYGVATARKNFPELPIHVGFDSWPTGELRQQKPHLVYGNPPCAAWSNAGHVKGKKWSEDARVNCTEQHFSLLKTLAPEIWCWESVPQALSKGREFVESLRQRANNQGYDVTLVLHDAQWCGLPQRRPRFMFVAHKIDVQFPTPNFAPPPSVPEALEGIRYIAKREMIRPSFKQEWMKDVPPGASLLKWWEAKHKNKKHKLDDRGRVMGRPSFGPRRLQKEGPGFTMSGYEMIHPTEDRWITVEEMAQLNGFPPSFILPASVGAAAKELARGVCPPVGAWFGRCFANALRANRPTIRLGLQELDYRQPAANL